MIAPPLPAAPYGAAAAVLAAAGAAKLRRPGDTARALALAGLPVGAATVRAGAAAELGVAAAALGAPGPVPAVLVAASYAAFSAYVAVALARRLPLSTCGCFGRPDHRPGPLHVAVDTAGCVAALAWLVSAGGRSWVAAGPGPALLAVTALLAVLAGSALAGAPTATGWWRGGRSRAPAPTPRRRW